MGILQTQFLADQREDGAVDHLILQMQGYRGLLAAAEVFDVMLTTNGQRMAEQLTLNGTGVVDLIHDTHIHLLPETGYSRHTSGMGLAHRLLHVLRMRVDNHRGTFGQGKEGPSALEDVGIGQEVHDTVLLTHRHTLVVGLEGSMELSMRQDDALGIARSTTGIEDVGDIVVRGLLL